MIFFNDFVDFFQNYKMPEALRLQIDNLSEISYVSDNELVEDEPQDDNSEDDEMPGLVVSQDETTIDDEMPELEPIDDTYREFNQTHTYKEEPQEEIVENDKFVTHRFIPLVGEPLINYFSGYAPTQPRRSRSIIYDIPRERLVSEFRLPTPQSTPDGRRRQD